MSCRYLWLVTCAVALATGCLPKPELYQPPDPLLAFVAAGLDLPASADPGTGCVFEALAQLKGEHLDGLEFVELPVEHVAGIYAGTPKRAELLAASFA